MTAAIVLVVGLFFTSAAFANGPMRCGNQLIEQGDTKADVLKACGPPVNYPYATVATLDTIPIEQWVYLFKNRGTRIVIFHGYQVQRIQSIPSHS